MLSTSSMQEVSYLFARDPSIIQPVSKYNTHESVVPVQLHKLFEEEEIKLSEQNWQNVFLRIKPSLTSNFNTQGCPFMILDNETLAAKVPKQSGKPIVHHYKFTNIFGPAVSQQELYQNVCLGSLRNFINGRNCFLFAYGATNAGKTHTIQGSVKNPGVIPRSINALFNTIKDKGSSSCKYKPDNVSGVVELDEVLQQQELKYKKMIFTSFVDKSLPHSTKSALPHKSQESLNHITEGTDNSIFSDFVSTTFENMKKNLDNTVIDVEDQGDNVFSVWVSFAEIYNEYIYDLLDMSNCHEKKKHLYLGENYQKEVYIKGLRNIFVTSGVEAYQVFLFGQHNLQMAPTSMNHTSSRSHSIFTIKLIKHVNTTSPSCARVSTFSFVDLAGAERAKKTCNVGERMKESQNINTSLHVLGRCLETIRSNQHLKEKRMIPFRDSKLTRLFQQTFSGRDKMYLIVNVNLGNSSFEETVNVLKFSAIAKQIVFERVPAPRRHALRTSRFSHIAMQSYNARKGTSRSGIAEPSSSLNVKSADCSQCQSLHTMIEKLRKQLNEQQQTNATLETAWNDRLKASEERMEELADWRINHLQEYYENQSKRRKCDCEAATHNSRVQELEEDVKYLEEKVANLEQLVAQFTGSQNELQIQKSKLQFELAAVKLELQDKVKLLEAKQLQTNSTLIEKDPLVAELERQLEAVHNLVKDKDAQIKDIKELLEEAKEDFFLHLKTEEDSDKRTEELEKHLAVKDEELEEVRTRLAESQALVTQHVAAQEAHQKLLEDRDEYKFTAAKYESLSKKLEIENEELRSTIARVEAKPSNLEMNGLEVQVLSMQDELKMYKDKLKVSEDRTEELESKLSSSSTAANSSISQDTLGKEIVLLQEEIKALLNTKTVLNEKLLAKTKECTALEQEEKAAIELVHMTELALQQEQKDTVSMKAEIEFLKSQLKLYEDGSEQEGERQNRILRDRQNIDLNDAKARPRRATRNRSAQDKNLHPSQVSNNQEGLEKGDNTFVKVKTRRKKLFNTEDELQIEPVNEQLHFIPVKPGVVIGKANLRRHQI